MCPTTKLGKVSTRKQHHFHCKRQSAVCDLLSQTRQPVHDAGRLCVESSCVTNGERQTANGNRTELQTSSLARLHSEGRGRLLPAPTPPVCPRHCLHHSGQPSGQSRGTCSRQAQGHGEAAAAGQRSGAAHSPDQASGPPSMAGYQGSALLPGTQPSGLSEHTRRQRQSHRSSFCKSPTDAPACLRQELFHVGLHFVIAYGIKGGRQGTNFTPRLLPAFKASSLRQHHHPRPHRPAGRRSPAFTEHSH